MKINGKPFPQWLNILIALFLISIIIEVSKLLLYSPGYSWKTLEVVTAKAGKNLLPDTLERKKWCDCVLTTIKKKYPSGLDNLSPDTVKVQVASTSYDCMRTVKESR